MNYRINNEFLLNNPYITVVGAGGTGGFVAESLCRLFTGRAATITLVDHDRVEPHNLLRQNFYPENVGQFKSQALAERLARNYNRPIRYSLHPFMKYKSSSCATSYPGLPSHGNRLIIGCADNAAARREMNDTLSSNSRIWLIDAGNDTTWGQVLIGNVGDKDHYIHKPPFSGEICNLLPAPIVQRPDLLTAIPTTPPNIDCAAALDLTDQDPTINQMMASLVIGVVRRMVAGTCPFMSLYLDMDLGSVIPSYISPEAALRAARNNPEITEIFEIPEGKTR